jgi:type II secretory pathway component GspD/PulD (secretin)
MAREKRVPHHAVLVRFSACTERDTMALEHPRLLAASLTAAILGTSCSTPSDSSNRPTDESVKPEPTAAGNGSGATQDPQSPQDQVAEERRAALVAKYLENAESLRANGNLAAAKSELLKAKDYAPTNERVRGLLAAVQAELGEAPGLVTNFIDEQMALARIGEERARTSVATQLQKAQSYAGEKNFAGALEELRQAALTIELKDQVDWMDLPQKVAAAKTETEKLYDQQQRASQSAENQKLAERLRQEYEETEARRRAQVDNLLLESQAAFENRRFAYAQELSEKAMALDPNSAIAYEMHNASVKAARDGANDDYYRERAKRIRDMLEAAEELKIPQTSVLEMDMPTWERARGRAARNATTAVMDPMDSAVWNQVRTAQVGKLTYTEETGAYTEVVKNLNLISGVQIIVTPEAREVINTENLKIVIELVGSMTLRDFLNHMCAGSTNLAWTVKNGVVILGTKSQAAGTITTEIYPVKDLVFKRTQFLPPKIRDIPGDGSDDTPRTGGEGEDPVSFIEIADLVNNVKEATDPKYWETDGVEVRSEDSGFLAVKASPEMQKQVQLVLSDMRRFATPIVTIDSKFLTISHNFMQEVGVDFRGLGGSGSKGSTVALDDLSNGLQSNSSRGLDNGGTGDPAANPLAGAFYNDGGDGDIRARTENYFTSDLSRVLAPTGGLTAGWTWLDDTQVSMILRAVEKQQDVEMVNSQILSVLNRERGHVAVINQTAYVRDFDVEVAQAAFIADPKVDVIQDGIVLDVQPVIQHDRKYIILNLNPTVAELTRPIPTFTTSLAGSTLPVTLQLPNLTVTNFSTTAKVPDGGTVLLGGLRQTLTKERRAEVPLLARLPLISFLFKQEGSADENRSLMVMVRAQITDVVDQMKR